MARHSWSVNCLKGRVYGKGSTLIHCRRDVRSSLRDKTVLLIGHRAFDESDRTSPLGGDIRKTERIWDWRRRHGAAESAAGFPVVSFRRAGSAAYIIATFGQRRFCEDSSVHDSDVCFFFHRVWFRVPAPRFPVSWQRSSKGPLFQQTRRGAWRDLLFAWSFGEGVRPEKVDEHTTPFN